MIPAYTVAVAGAVALIFMAAMLWRIRQLSKTLEDAKAVIRVTAGNWGDIQVYVGRSSELLCPQFNCPTSGHIPWPSQRMGLRQVIEAFKYHYNEHHLGANRYE